MVTARAGTKAWTTAGEMTMWNKEQHLSELGFTLDLAS